jgi:hypothetical protein
MNLSMNMNMAKVKLIRLQSHGVQSVVVIQYALGKLVYFRGQNNFPGIYRFIDNFLSAYFTKFSNYTIGDQL